MKKLLSLLVTAVMVFAIAAAVPEREGYTHIEGITLTAKAASTTLSALKAKYPHNSYWYGPYKYDGYSLYSCMGYAATLGRELYGSTFLKWKRDTDLSTLKPGDIILSNYGSSLTSDYVYHSSPWRHTVMVVKVSGDNIEITQCNSGGANLVTWNVSKTKTYYKNTLGWGKNSINGVYHAPSEAPETSTPTGSVMTTGAGKTIPEGDYWIASELDQRYFVDIPGDRAITKDDAGTNAQMWTWGDQMPTQYGVFHFDYLDNGFYRITQKGSDMSLDVSGCSAERGANVQMWTSNESNAQQWSVEYQSGRGYRLRARCSGFYLDVSGAAVANGTNVQMWTGNDSQAQRFALIPYAESAAIPDGTYKIQYDYNKDYYLTANGDSSGYANTTNVQITSRSADEYEFKYVGEGYYSIVEKRSGLSLDLNNSASAGYLADFTNIQLYEYKGSRNQLWFVQKSSSGTYFIYNKLSGFLLDVKGGQPSEGGDVAQYHYNGSGSQQWDLIRTSLAGDADDNMTVDVSDALLIQQYIAGWDVKIDLLNSNVDGDWFVTVSDVLLIQQAIAGWDVSLECKAPLDLSDLPDMTAHI